MGSPGKTILITGASDGIGAASARGLAAKGHRLLVTGRSKQKLEVIARVTGAEHFVADFTRLDDVRALAEAVRAALDGQGLEVLANNAGGIFGDRTPTVDGFEKTLQVNHLAPFLLTHLLLNELRAGGGAVINTSSVANRVFGRLDVDDLNNHQHFSAHRAYGDAKLANILFTQGLHARYRRQGVASVAFHPGNVATNFASDTTSPLRYLYGTWLHRLALISPERGGATLSWFIEGTPDATWQSGAYYDERTLSNQVNLRATATLADQLWERSAVMTGVA
ncbi:MAG: SDR family NAD(P)-dependent oxidoreductase [Propionicimonas sp.]